MPELETNTEKNIASILVHSSVEETDKKLDGCKKHTKCHRGDIDSVIGISKEGMQPTAEDFLKEVTS